jgi:hypothetical protein
MKRSVDVTCGICCAMLGLWVTCLNAQSISTQAEMHKRVIEVYNFSPHKLTDAGRSAKSTEMDGFWNEVKAHQDLELPLLRAELANSSNPAFFMSDGSSLLLSLSKEPTDGVLAAEAMSHADLVDVVPRAYFYAVHSLSVQGVDTTKAALHILDDPRFAVSVPQHAMTLDQPMSLAYLLLPVDEEKWMHAAQQRFANEKDETAQKSLLLLFFYSQTQEGDSAIRSTVNDSARSDAVRKDAQKYIGNAKAALTMKTSVKGSEASIRAERRKRLAAVSDEAIDDMQEMTVRLIQLRNGHAKSIP